MPDLTVHEKLLLAAAGLDGGGQTTFSAEDLVVAAWKLEPQTFGLAGYVGGDGRPLYPNSNRVFVEIMGSKPIRKQGLLAKAGTKRFRLTESGRQRVAELQSARTAGEENGPAAAAKVAFDRDTSRKLQKLLASRAVDKMRRGRETDITFHDASSFWGISARSSAMGFQGRLGDVEGILRAARAAAEQRPIQFEHGGRSYTKDDIAELLGLHEAMLARFSDQLNVIRGRRDER
ncbi:MAG: hypothetical protein ACR2OB_06365 [Solirubrobacteraceae bacterium]